MSVLTEIIDRRDAEIRTLREALEKSNATIEVIAKQRGIYMEALEKLAAEKGAWDGECNSIPVFTVNKIVRDALAGAGKGEEPMDVCPECEVTGGHSVRCSYAKPAPKPEVRSCETCSHDHLLRGDHPCRVCTRNGRMDDRWTPAAPEAKE